MELTIVFLFIFLFTFPQQILHHITAKRELAPLHTLSLHHNANLIIQAIEFLDYDLPGHKNNTFLAPSHSSLWSTKAHFMISYTKTFCLFAPGNGMNRTLSRLAASLPPSSLPLPTLTCSSRLLQRPHKQWLYQSRLPLA